MYERLLEIFNGACQCKVLLVGDFMLDNYLLGDIDRISPEAPVVIMNVIEREERPGGAGSVAVDLAALGAQVLCLGVVGKDSNGNRLCEKLTDLGNVDIEGLIAADDRPTTFKQRIIGLAQHRHRQQLMRIDEESKDPISAKTQKQLKAKLNKAVEQCDVVCLEDYDKGVLCEEFARTVIDTAVRAGKKVIVDPASIRDYQRYRGAWLIKPNRRELAQMTAMEIEDEQSYHQATRKLSRDYNIDNVAVTLDKAGAYLYQRTNDTGQLVPTRPRSVYDVTGAGDMVLAMLGLLAGAHYDNIAKPNLAEMTALAMVAGGLEVEQFGCVGISRQEITAELDRQLPGKNNKLRHLDGLIDEVQRHRRRKQQIVFTNGCFDLLHPGHVELLSFAKQQGDILIVAMNSDNSVRKLKGENRPILKQDDRSALLMALEMVDYVIIFDEPDPEYIIRAVCPDVLVKGTDWKGAVVGQEWLEKHGGRVALMPLVEGRSTTNIIAQVLEKNNAHNNAKPTVKSEE